MFDEYQKISKKTMEEVIKSEFSGEIKNGFVTIGKLYSIFIGKNEYVYCIIKIMSYFVSNNAKYQVCIFIKSTKFICFVKID